MKTILDHKGSVIICRAGEGGGEGKKILVVSG